MHNKEIIAMLLAGGQGSRLRLLTKNLAKPAVPFGGHYRIIDFSLSNCINSGIDTVGVLTQYKPQILNSHVGTGNSWDFCSQQGGVTILPPFVDENGGEWYKGTAHAVYQNINYINTYKPEHVLIISGDHIYKMDYSKMFQHHLKNDADLTIAVVEVPWQEASRFGIMKTNEKNEIIEFEEKPEKPKSNLASMGIYIFKTKALLNNLIEDAEDACSAHDFGKNIIPKMVSTGQRTFSYEFTGYWRDVGTIESYWLASMDILNDNTDFDFFDTQWNIYTLSSQYPPHYIGPSACIKQSLVSEGCRVFGEVNHSIVFPGARIGKGAKILNSVIMSNVIIEDNVTVTNSIIGEDTLIGERSIIGGDYHRDDVLPEDYIDPKITIVEEKLTLPPHTRLGLLLHMKRTEQKLSEVAGV